MKKLVMILPIILLSACSEDLYDCHLIQINHTFKETKLCDGVCNPMFKISDVKEQIIDKHIVVEHTKLKETIDSEYTSAEMVNSLHPDFIKQIGKLPIKIIKLECKKF